MAVAKRKKKFFSVEIPIIKKETFLQAFEVEELNGRFLRYDLTRILRGKNAIIQAEVKVEGENPIGVEKKFWLLPSYLKRMVRKGTNYVEDSFEAECKNAIIRIKPFLITRRKVPRRIRKALREKAREEIINYCKTRTADRIFDDILKNNLQKPLSLVLKKIYPLSLCEIRIIEIEKVFEDKKVEKSEEEVAEEETPVKKSRKKKEVEAEESETEEKSENSDGESNSEEE